MPIQSTHPDYNAWVGRWTTCRDAVEGSYAIKLAGPKYLPMLSAHFQPVVGHKQYEAYKDRALWFGATDRTLNGYVGAVMRRDPGYVVPDLIQSRLEDITDAGQNATEFIHSQVKELLTTGRYGLLVDKAAEDVVEGEPAFIKLYYPENITNWVCDKDGCLLAVVLKESIFIPKDGDPYDLEERTQLRELVKLPEGYTVRLWVQKKNSDGFLADEYELAAPPVQPTLRGNAIEDIPFVFVSCDKDSMSCSKPPIMDLVDANINHYQLDADYRHGLHFTALPTPVFTGVDEGKDYFLGSEVAINLRNPDCKAFFLEFQGMGLSAIKEAMEERKSQMASLGAALIQNSRTGKGVETAEAAKIQHAGETSLLSTVVSRVEEAMEEALGLVAAWEGLTVTDEGIEITINRDFIDATLAAADITAMVGAWQAGTLPVTELYWNFQRGGVLNPATTVEVYEAAVTKMAADKQANALALATAAPDPGSDSSEGGTEPPKAPGAGGSGPRATGARKAAIKTDPKED